MSEADLIFRFGLAFASVQDISAVRTQGGDRPRHRIRPAVCPSNHPTLPFLHSSLKLTDISASSFGFIRGKPHKATYDFAQAMLETHLKEMQGPSAVLGKNVYMVGGKPFPFSSSTSPSHDALMVSAREILLKIPSLSSKYPFLSIDNPASDISGAVAFGWKSLLVRTGVFKGGEPDAIPTRIVNDVEEGVRWALEKEGLM
jgi:ribonucleotide monophosphatase NagD (HAD superfamily)